MRTAWLLRSATPPLPSARHQSNALDHAHPLPLPLGCVRPIRFCSSRLVVEAEGRPKHHRAFPVAAKRCRGRSKRVAWCPSLPLSVASTCINLTRSNWTAGWHWDDNFIISMPHCTLACGVPAQFRECYASVMGIGRTLALLPRPCSEYTRQVHKIKTCTEKTLRFQWVRETFANPATPTIFWQNLTQVRPGFRLWPPLASFGTRGRRLPSPTANLIGSTPSARPGHVGMRRPSIQPRRASVSF